LEEYKTEETLFYKQDAVIFPKTSNCALAFNFFSIFHRWLGINKLSKDLGRHGNGINNYST